MDEWSYDTAPDLQESVAERLRGFPRYPDVTVHVARTVLHIGLRALLRTYFRLSVKGRDNLPADGSFIMICNHSSHLDTLCLLSSLPLLRLHRAYPAAASDYFFSNLPRAFLSVIFVNGLPFDRVKRGSESLELCRQLLDRPGNILILFPEGTRTPETGEVGRFRSGIGRLAAGTATSIVPCYLSGAGEAFPKGAGFPRPRRLRLYIGTPRSFADASPQDTEAVVSICDSLREDVIALADTEVLQGR